MFCMVSTVWRGGGGGVFYLCRGSFESSRSFRGGMG